MRACLRLSLTERRTFPWSFQVSFQTNSKSCWSFLVLMVLTFCLLCKCTFWPTQHFWNPVITFDHDYSAASPLSSALTRPWLSAEKMSSCRFYLCPCHDVRTGRRDVAVLDSRLTFVQKLMKRSLYWPYLYTLSQSLLLHKKSLAFKCVFSNLQVPIQHADGDCHLQSAHSALQKLKFVPSCYSTYLGELLTCETSHCPQSTCYDACRTQPGEEIEIFRFILSFLIIFQIFFSSVGTVDFIVLEPSELQPVFVANTHNIITHWETSALQ